MTASSISEFVAYCETELCLHDKLIVQELTDPNESFYKSLPVCIIDAVFSIGVKYRSVEKAEEAFFNYFGLKISREYPVINEYKISNFICDMDTFDTFEQAAEQGFRNKQRTSSRNGILKAEACYRIAKVFEKYGIDTLDDFNKYEDKVSLDNDILKVKGQGSGIMLKYLYMLAGDANEVKPDRHMVNFMRRYFPYLTMSVKDHPEIKSIIKTTVSELQKTYPMLTERFLDVLIWDHMR